ncbi:Unknown protein, partial [Striga hermonthica]
QHLPPASSSSTSTSSPSIVARARGSQLTDPASFPSSGDSKLATTSLPPSPHSSDGQRPSSSMPRRAPHPLRRAQNRRRPPFTMSRPSRRAQQSSSSALFSNNMNQRHTRSCDQQQLGVRTPASQHLCARMRAGHYSQAQIRTTRARAAPKHLGSVASSPEQTQISGHNP